MAKIKLRDWKPSTKPNKWFKTPVSEIVETILQLVEQYEISLIVRQVHYRLVETPKANHPNTKQAYARTSRILTDMRYAGLLDWDKITDETRDVYKTTSYEDINKAVKNLLRIYRRDRWKDNKNYVEVWVEKRTLVNLFYQITDKYDIYLASGGGFSSASYIYEAVKRLYPKSKEGKKITILYFGDIDPSGDFMSEDIEKRFAEWGIHLEIKRICLNDEHIEKYHLKKRFDVKAKKGDKIYNKIEADPRAKRFYEKYGELFQVELEALDPNILIQMLENSILQFVDSKQQNKIRKIERKEVQQIKQKRRGVLRNKNGKFKRGD